MKKIWILVLLTNFTLLLSACGGGQDNNTKTPPSNNPPIGQPIANKQFIALATGSNCADARNRLFVVDQKYVLWDKAGNCADASYAQTLFGTTPSVTLCSNMDSIAGPRLSCEDNTLKSMFSTMINNLDKNNLGLDASHQVQAIANISGTLASIPFNALNASFYRGSAPLNIIIKDKSAWDQFWKNAQISPPVGSPSDSSFFNIMALGTFYKTQNDCSITQILKLVSNGQKLTAEYMEEERIAISRCDQNPLTSTPMSLIETVSLDLPVEFNNVSSKLITHKLIDETQFSNITTTKNVVIKDQSAWQKLWAEHKNNNSIAPSIDFTKNMVIAIFSGSKSCFGIENLRAWSSDTTFNVTYHNPLPGPATACPAVVLTPSSMIEVPLSNQLIEFNAITIFK